MNNIAFIVDGFTEKLIIERLCPKKPIRRTDLNGRDVTVKAIVEKIASLIRLLNNRFHPIIIIVDKEERNISFQEMCEEIEKGLENEGIDINQIIVAVADRMLENWILADWNTLCNNQIETPKPDSTDGLNGAGIIKKIRGSYDKTSDGINLFMSSSFGTMYANSPSFRYLIDKLRHNVNCWYITN